MRSYINVILALVAGLIAAALAPEGWGVFTGLATYTVVGGWLTLRAENIAALEAEVESEYVGPERRGYGHHVTPDNPSLPSYEED
ncbi:MAG: hypothetical protein GX856_13950 [Gammaproteobacteria bacterium]|jgi:hypothetical protein|nr:hypothetical protein [Gammaproteobacteria bacterium]